MVKVCGFTFLRNAELLAYPFVESIKSALPICDEFVVALGPSEDNTESILREIDPDKVRIIKTKWNEKMRDRGYVYAQQKMIAHFNCSGDWAFYLEGDEVLHESEICNIRSCMYENLERKEVEAIVFDYYHFFGSPSWVASSLGWYRRAPRIIRNNVRVYSPDGLFFVVMDKNKKGRYPRAVLANAHIYHYGHVRPSSAMQMKIRKVSKYWGKNDEGFAGYDIDPEVLKPFHGNHPNIMEEWIKNCAEVDFRPNPNHVLTKREKRHRLGMKMEKLFGIDLSRKHFKLL